MFVFFVIDLFVWESWCLLFILLLTSVPVFNFVHLSSSLWTSSGSSRLFYIKLSWKVQNVSRNLGVLRTFLLFSFFHVIFLAFFPQRKSTSLFKYFEWGSTQVKFLFCATGSSYHIPACFTFNAFNGFILIVITQKNVLFIHAFLFFSVWLINSFNEDVHELRKLVMFCFF